MRFLLVFAVLGMSLLFTACESDDDGEEPPRPDRGDTYLRIVHAAPGLPEVELYADYLEVKTRITPAMSYMQAFPDSNYLMLEATIPSDEFGNPTYTLQAHFPSDSLGLYNKIDRVEPITLLLQENMHYSVWMVDSTGGKKRFVFQEDPEPNYADSTAGLIRFANLSPTEGIRLDYIALSDSNSAQIGAQGIYQFSGYQGTAADLYRLEAYDADGNLVGVHPNMRIRPQSAATVYYDGDNLGFAFME